MRITMLETRRGSEDGFNVRQYLKDQTYDVADGLARDLLNNGWAYNAEEEDATSLGVISALAEANMAFSRIFGTGDAMRILNAHKAKVLELVQIAYHDWPLKSLEHSKNRWVLIRRGLMDMERAMRPYVPRGSDSDPELLRKYCEALDGDTESGRKAVEQAVEAFILLYRRRIEKREAA